MNVEEKIKQILSIPINRIIDKNKLTRDERNKIFNVYKYVTGKIKNPGCGNCYLDVYLYFKKMSNKNLINMKNDPNTNEFAMYEGKKIHLHHTVLMRANCTDNDALKVLKATPGAIKFFERFPPNWKELAADFDPIATAKKSKLQPEKTQKDSFEESEKKEPQKIDANAYDQRKETLESKNINDLKELAGAMDLPKAEYGKLKKPELIAYILDKTK